ncbi:MAG: hypothetical protein L6Q57_03785 [Alphaproteobacteria bacterium]|nr:hypothetical protein [Alphaproteobacteria bacterium]
MQVSISKAAEMAGVTRATFYRHIERKGIHIIKDAENNPKVDVAELIRVYGDTVRQNLLVANDEGAGGFSAREGLRTRSEMLAQEIAKIQDERARERAQLLEQIEMLRAALAEAQAQNKSLTEIMIAQGQRDDDGGISRASLEEQRRKIDSFEQTLLTLKRMNARIYQEIMARRPKAAWRRWLGLDA